MNKRTIRQEVGEILDKYCDGCFLKSYHRSSFGKNYALSFCNQQCTVGEKLQEYGILLSKSYDK